MGMSIGVGTSRDGKESNILDICKRADDNMYECKAIQTVNPKNQTIDLLLAALAEKDFVALGHVDRLITMSEEISTRLNLSPGEKNNLILLSKVHDLGKVGITDAILLKSTKLSIEEYEIIKTHHQKSMTTKEAIAELRKCSGVKFEPALVEEVVKLIE